MASCDTNSLFLHPAGIPWCDTAKKEKPIHLDQIKICSLIMVIFSLTFHVLMMSLSFYIKKAERSSYSAVPNYCSGETDMNRFGSHPIHENRPLYEGPPPQGPSEARRAGSFFWIFSHRTATGAPLRGWRHSSYLGNHLIIFSIMYREDSNLSFVKTNINQSSSLENYEYCITWNCTAKLRNVFLLLYHVSVNPLYNIIHRYANQKRISTFSLSDRANYVSVQPMDFATIGLKS
jgi:hypothetical protein